MAQIFDLIAAGQLIWFASTVLQFEISRNPDPVRREDNLKLLSNSTQYGTLLQPRIKAFKAVES